MTTSHFDEAFVHERLGYALKVGKQRGTPECEALFDGFEGDLLRLGEARVAQASYLLKGQIQVRVIDAGREGIAWTSDLSDEGLRHAAEAAHTQALLAPPPTRLAHLPAPLPIPAMPLGHGLDEASAALTAGEKADWLAETLAAHRTDGLALAGRFHTGLKTRAVRSSRQVATYHQGSTCDVALSSLELPAGHHASSFRARMTSRIDRQTLAALAQECRTECHRARNPIEAGTGAWDVILAPAAMADIMQWFLMIGFGSTFFEDGRAFTAGRIGEKVTGSAFSLVDDGLLPDSEGVAIPFDSEGMPKQRVTLIQEGVAQSIVHNTRSGDKVGCLSTGHATADPMWPSATSTANNPVMAGGESDLDGLISGVKRGLLVTRLHYVNGLLDPRRAVMTGLLRDAAFLIEDGEIRQAVRPMRFTDSMLEAFARIDGPLSISARREPQKVGYSGGCGLLPHVLIRGLNFTSGR